MKDKQKRKKERTWAEAARMVIFSFSIKHLSIACLLHRAFEQWWKRTGWRDQPNKAAS